VNLFFTDFILYLSTQRSQVSKYKPLLWGYSTLSQLSFTPITALSLLIDGYATRYLRCIYASITLFLAFILS